jgi:hypothetical protein
VALVLPDDDVPDTPVPVDPVPVEPVPVEPVAVDPVAVDPVLVDPVLDDPVLDDPEVACEAGVELPELLVLVPLVLLAVWVEPGSATATAPVASTPATATPAVTAEIRCMPRRRRTDAANGPPAGLTGISGFLPLR